MKKILFLDRDGVINIDHSYVYKIEDFEWIPGIFEGLKKAVKDGYECIIVTNQSGVARGYFTEDDVQKLQKYIEESFAAEDIPLLGYYYCPHLPDAPISKYNKVCKCRKPEPGMLLQAMKDISVDKNQSFLIGDSKRDIVAANRAGIRGYLYQNEPMEQFIADILAKENSIERI